MIKLTSTDLIDLFDRPKEMGMPNGLKNGIMSFIRSHGYSENYSNFLYQLIKKRQITSLVLSGGGIRGGVYVGTFVALEEAGILKGIKSMSGSSIGGMTATLMATGMSPQKFKEISMNQDFESLLGERESWYGIRRDGKPMLSFLLKYIKENILYFFKNRFDEIKKQNNLSEEEIEKLLKIKEKLNANDQDNIDDENSESSERDEFLTFADLASLRQYDNEYFKDLTLTAVNRQTGVLQYFNAYTTPNVSIAHAARASGSLPCILKPQVIGDEEYVDGGYLNNIPTEAESEIAKEETYDPTEAFCYPSTLDEDKLNELKKKRLVFAFSEVDNDPVYQALYTHSDDRLYQPGWISRFMLNTLASWWAGICTNQLCTEQAEADYKRLQNEYPLQTIQMKTGIESTDFNGFLKRKEHLYYEGYFSTKDYLINHDLDVSNSPYEFRKFAFHFFKNYEKQASKFSYFRVTPFESKKAKILFSFCSDVGKIDKIQLNNMAYNLTYISLLDRRNNTLRTDTRAATALIDSLNCVYTHLEVKERFAKALKIENLDDLKNHKFKFTIKHLDDFLEENITPKKDPKSLFYSNFISESNDVKYDCLSQRLSLDATA